MNKIKRFWNNNPVGNNFVKYENSKEFFIKYDEFRYKTEGHIIDELDSLNLKNKKVLEIGLGQGSDSQKLIERGAIYYGIDLTPESVKRVKKRFKLFNLKYKKVILGDAKNLPFENNFFDIIYSHGVIHHSPDIKKIVNEIYRVLNKNGELVLMLYNKNSFNYFVSIYLIRRIGLIFIILFPFLKKIISKYTGEEIDRINIHVLNFKKFGLKYLKMKNFLHKSTDGPLNEFSSVWTKNSSKELLKKFKQFKFKIHFLNERQLIFINKILSKSFKNKLSRIFGWHLWIFSKK